MMLVRGLVVAVLLGPVLSVGVLLAGSALLGSVVTGWVPAAWVSANPVDWLFGGAAGDAVAFVRFMLGAALAAGSWTAIRWAFTGEAH
jgi:hypothetical protein